MSLNLHTPEEKLAALANKQRTDNSQPAIDFSEYIFADPTTFVGEKNTRVYATPLLNSVYTGRVTLLYDRIDLTTVTGLSIAKGSANTVHELISSINETFGLKFTDKDFEDNTLPSPGDSFNLKATAKNKMYTGQTSIRLLS